MKYVYIPIYSTIQTWKKGDRIVVQIDDDCFLGTVTSIRQGKIHMLCDDGDTHVVSLDSKRILGHGIKQKVKKAFPKKDANKYIKETQSVRPRRRPITPSNVEKTDTIFNENEKSSDILPLHDAGKLLEWGQWYLVTLKGKYGIETVPAVVTLLKKDVVVFIKDDLTPLVVEKPFAIKIESLPDEIKEVRRRLTRKQVYDKYKILDKYYKADKNLETALEDEEKLIEESKNTPKPKAEVIHAYPDKFKWVLLKSQEDVKHDKSAPKYLDFDSKDTRYISLRDNIGQTHVLLRVINNYIDNIFRSEIYDKEDLKKLKDFVDKNYLDLDILSSMDGASGRYRLLDVGIRPSVDKKELEEHEKKVAYEGTSVLHRYPNGFKWVLLETPEAIERVRYKIAPNAVFEDGFTYIVLRSNFDSNILVLQIDDSSKKLYSIYRGTRPFDMDKKKENDYLQNFFEKRYTDATYQPYDYKFGSSCVRHYNSALAESLDGKWVNPYRLKKGNKLESLVVPEDMETLPNELYIEKTLKIPEYCKLKQFPKNLKMGYRGRIYALNGIQIPENLKQYS